VEQGAFSARDIKRDINFGSGFRADFSQASRPGDERDRNRRRTAFEFCGIVSQVFQIRRFLR